MARPRTNDQQELGPSNKRRVICDIEKPATVIDGIGFAPVKVGERTVHISRQVEEPVWSRMCKIPGFRLSEHDEGYHGTHIDAAIDEAQRPLVPTPGSDAARNLQQDLDDQRQANLAMSRDLVVARRQIETLTNENARLRQQVQELRNAGLRRETPAEALGNVAQEAAAAAV